jgi:hypothetical protein
MLPFAKNIIRSNQELHIPDFKSRLFERFANRRVREGLAVFEVPARTL